MNSARSFTFFLVATSFAVAHCAAHPAAAPSVGHAATAPVVASHRNVNAVTSLHDAPQSLSADAAATVAMDPCTSARRITEAAFAGAQREWRERTGHPVVIENGRRDAADMVVGSVRLGACFPAGRGAWTFVLQDARFVPASTDAPAGPARMGARLALAHVDEHGNVTTHDVRAFLEAPTAADGAPPVPGANCCEDFGGSGIQQPVLFDFDGNGESEIYVSASFHHEGDDEHDGHVWSFDGHAIVPYPGTATMDIRTLEDVNADGRPDAILYETLDAGSSCGSGFPLTVDTPRFVAISNPDGSFDRDGAAARAYARTWCPSVPARIASAQDVVCARLRGVSDAVVRQRINARTSPWDCGLEENDRPQRRRNASTAYHGIVAALRAVLPFRLR